MNGYLAEPGDINVLSQAMTALLKQPEKAKLIGKTGHMLVGRHNIQTTLDRHEQLYSTLVTQKEAQRTKIKAQDYWKRAREWMNL